MCGRPNPSPVCLQSLLTNAVWPIRALEPTRSRRWVLLGVGGADRRCWTEWERRQEKTKSKARDWGKVKTRTIKLSAEFRCEPNCKRKGNDMKSLCENEHLCYSEMSPRFWAPVELSQHCQDKSHALICLINMICIVNEKEGGMAESVPWSWKEEGDR